MITGCAKQFPVARACPAAVLRHGRRTRAPASQTGMRGRLANRAYEGRLTVPAGTLLGWSAPAQAGTWGPLDCDAPRAITAAAAAHPRAPRHDHAPPAMSSNRLTGADGHCKARAVTTAVTATRAIST